MDRPPDIVLRTVLAIPRGDFCAFGVLGCEFSSVASEPELAEPGRPLPLLRPLVVDKVLRDLGNFTATGAEGAEYAVSLSDSKLVEIC